MEAVSIWKEIGNYKGEAVKPTLAAAVEKQQQQLVITDNDCSWRKSCISSEVIYPMVLDILGGAGFASTRAFRLSFLNRNWTNYALHEATAMTAVAKAMIVRGLISALCSANAFEILLVLRATQIVSCEN